MTRSSLPAFIPWRSRYIPWGYSSPIPAKHLMDTWHDPYRKANYLFRKADYQRWHRAQSRQHILRSQLGFTDSPSSRPKACRGCTHYHGTAYGQSRATRTTLICGFHPYGWQDTGNCPDWQASE